MIKKIIREILYVIGLKKRPKYKVNILKIEQEDFDLVQYKGTTEKSMRIIAKIYHPETRVGKLSFGKHVSIRSTVELDMVGDISIGNYTIFSDYVKIFTHEHNLKTKNIILSEDEKNGVIWSNLHIGEDVYFGLNCIVTKSVTNIPQGVVIGANSVLTKNPKAYEIWAGTPAKKIGDRK